MTETQADYLTDTAVTCPKCGRVVGYYFPVNSQIWLKVGKITCRVIRAKCECGSEFDFDASSKRLEDLIDRIKSR